MKVIDYIVIGLVVLSIVLGMVFGLSKRIRKSPFGLVSIILTIITSFAILSFVISISQVNELLKTITSSMLLKDNWFLTFLVKIRFEIILLIILVSILVLVLKYFVCKKIADILEYDNKISLVLNKILGVVYMVAVFGFLFLITIEIIYLSSGTDGWAYNAFKGSLLKIDYLYENNPIVSLFKYLKSSYDNAVTVLEAGYYGILQ